MKFYSNKFGIIEDSTPIDQETSANNGEKFLKQYLRSIGYTVIDVHKNEQYFDKDIDMFATRQPDSIEEPVAIEVKWDSKINHTGNLFLEFRHRKFDKDGAVIHQDTGWFNICQADLLFYGDSKNKKYYVFKFPELKRYIYSHKMNYPTTEVPDYGTKDVVKDERGRIIQTLYIRGSGNGWLVPLKELVENVGCQVLQLK